MEQSQNENPYPNLNWNQAQQREVVVIYFLCLFLIYLFIYYYIWLIVERRELPAPPPDLSSCIMNKFIVVCYVYLVSGSAAGEGGGAGGVHVKAGCATAGSLVKN